jgi:hypothetical protein
MVILLTHQADPGGISGENGGIAMKKCASEIYSKIVTAKIGELISVKHKNGINYEYSITDALTEQGYKKGIDFDSVFDWGRCQTYIKKLTEIRPYTEPKHNIKIGDIFYNSWGYEQTNIDFYQVVSTTAKTITLRAIKGASDDYNAYYMTGSKVAAKDNFCGDEPIRKTPYLMDGKWRISFEFGAGSQWDGSPMSYSCYA